MVIGRDEQFAVGLLAGIPGEGIKQVCHIGTQSWITGKIAQIRIDAARDRIIIARAHVHIATQPIRLATHHQTHFGVRFQPEYPIDHMHPGLFEGPRPGNIMLFVKARLEFDQDRHLLVVLTCLHERLDDGRILPYAVQGLLDR